MQKLALVAILVCKNTGIAFLNTDSKLHKRGSALLLPSRDLSLAVPSPSITPESALVMPTRLFSLEDDVATWPGEFLN